MLALGLIAAALAGGPPPLKLEDGAPLRYALSLEVDPTASTFRGELTLDLRLDGARRRLWLDAEGLSFQDLTIEAGGRVQPVRVVPGDEDTVGLRWDRAVRGEARLRARWTGPIDPKGTSGPFSQREGADAYLFTQLEATEARKVFPSFDQPEFKTPFQLTLRVPAGLGAFSNSSVLSSTPDGDGWTKVVFAETAPLPTYLVAFAVGPFDVVDAGRAGRAGVPVRVLTPRGRGADAAWAAQITGPLLEDLERWFDLPYPYDKLDVVSLPQPVGWGAMENAGLITMEQSWLIARPEDDTPTRRRDCAEVLGHELAHQWFGDLVTPRWWDDLWLNESFASWMATHLVIARWPEWGLDVERVAWQGEAMAADGLESARRVREPIREPGDIELAFDTITYLKGEAVLGMIEAWLGPERFQQGVRAYMAAHAHGTATADDLIAALAAVGGPEVPLVLASFLEQPGVPELDLRCEAGEGGAALQVEVARWTPSGPESGRWTLPFCARYPTAAGPARACAVLDERGQTVPLPGAEACPAWVVPNDGQRGYYRVAWREAELVALLGAADAGLSTAERVGLLQDGSAQVSRGAVAPGALLGQLPALLALGERQVTAATLDLALGLDAHHVPAELRPAYAGFLSRTYGPLLAGLGLDAAPDDDDPTRRLRVQLVEAVGLVAADPAVRDALTPRVEAWLSTREGLDPDLVPVALQIVGQGGGLPWFERLREAAMAEPDRERREAILRAMGGLRDRASVEASLDWVISGALPAAEVLPVLTGHLDHPDAAEAQWDWARAHFDAVEALAPAPLRAYLVYLGAGFCDAEHAAEVEEFFRPRVGRWPGGRRLLDQVLEGAGQCEDAVQAAAPGVRDFLTAPPSPAP